MTTSITIFHWLPRIICIAAILFVSMFALDAFDPNLTVGKQILGFLIHLVPTYVLIAVLIVSWKWEMIGGIIFIAIGAIFSPFIFTHNYAMNQSVWMSIGIVMMLNVPFILVGGLFLASHFLKRKEAKKQNS